MNGLMQELVARIDARYSVESKNMSMGDWICQNTHLRGRPFTFDRYPFQKAIADDMHPNMDVIKPSQVGLSEIQVRKSLAFIARNRGTNLIFTMPNDDMFERMSSTRILPLAKEERAFNLGEEKAIRSKSLIQVGTSFMFVTGAKEGDATSISADVVFNDEIDLTNQSMLALFNSRLQNSDWKINQRFSTPTFHNYGVDGGYQSSDQHEYMCQCDSCNHWNIPRFTKDFISLPGLPDSMALEEIDESLIDAGKISLLDAEVVCEKCRAPLDLGRTEKREWVAKYASRTHHRGYRVRPFSTNRLKPEYIITQMFRYRQKDYMRGWYNTVLGEAYNDGSARLSDADLTKCFTPQSETPEPDAGVPTWVAIDMGKTCHVIVAQGNDLSRMHIVMFKTVPVESVVDEVEALMATYNVVGGACDRHPYTPTADEIFRVSNGKVLPVEYRGTKDFNLVKDPVDPETITHAQVNRTKVIDDIVLAIRKGRVRFSGYGNQRSTIIEHFKDMVRDETPETPAKWVKLTGNDHYFHAGAFLAAAVSLKELQHGLYSDNRSEVFAGGVNFGTNSTSLGLKSLRRR